MTAGKPENWGTLTPEQKRAQRLQWLVDAASKIKFVSPEAEKN